MIAMKTPLLLLLLSASLIGCSTTTSIPPVTGVLDTLGAAREGGGSAQYLIGTFYEQGSVLPANADRAAAWFQRGADGGFPHAKWGLAKLYIDGRGVQKDLVKANQLLDEAAQQGFLVAQRDYVLFLYRGAPIELRDPIRAYGWLAVVKRYYPQAYSDLAFIEEAIKGSLNASQLEEAELLRSSYPPLYPPWNQR